MTHSVLHQIPVFARRDEADFYNLLPVGHHTTSAQGVFIQMNDVELRWLGYTRDEVIGKLGPKDILSEPSRSKFELNFARMARQGYMRDMEYELQRKDGTTFPVLVNALAIKDGQGNCLGGRAIIVDLSARREAEQALRRHEAALLQAQRIARIGNYEIDLARTSTNDQCIWSDETYRILGRDPSQGPLSSDEFLEHCVHPEDRAHVAQVIEAALLRGGVADCEYRIVRPDGEVRYVRDVAEPVYAAKGKLERYFGVIHDITSIKLAQSQTLKTEARYRHLVEHSHDGVILLSATGTIVYVSPSGQKLLGWPLEKLIGRASQELCHPEDVPSLAAAMERLTQCPDEPVTHRIRVAQSDGTWRWLETCKSNRLGDPVLQAIVCNFRDVTEQHKAREQLKSTNRQLHKLSQHLQQVREEERASLARELHDELSATLSAINLFLGDPETDEQRMPPEALARVRELAHTAVEATRRITAKLRPSVLDHHGLWAAIDWFAQKISVGRKLACEIDIDAVRKIALDENASTAVFRIVQEALRNVARHAGADEVRITAWRAQQQLLLRIDDNGRGIAETDKAKTDSWGIVGMRERALALEGELSISRLAARGTRVELRVPLASRGRPLS